MITLVLDVETTFPQGLGEDEAAWEACRRMAEKRELDTGAFVALCPPLAEVICVGLYHLERDIPCISLICPIEEAPSAEAGTVLPYDDECALLTAVNDLIGKGNRLVTFNGRGFDLPVLIHRMVANGIAPHRFLLGAANEYRFKPDKHIDLLEWFTFFGAGGRYSLEAYAIGWGIKNPKGVYNGAQAGDLPPAELAAYNLGDLRATAALYRRWKELAA